MPEDKGRQASEEEEEDDDDEYEGEDDDAFIEIIEDFDNRLAALDNGTSAFMKAMAVILGDISLILNEKATESEKKAAFSRFEKVVGVLQMRLTPSDK